ncbi:MAG: hypothetical protein DRP38_04875 [Thermotogae bacterium]|nr:MAG: hypothetical protein DRP38_04875 [Thermotogota bacterium]
MAKYEGGGNADEKWRREIFHLSVGVSSMSYVNDDEVLSYTFENNSPFTNTEAEISFSLPERGFMFP